ncbi:vitamin K epoxide reductase family protein [Candidatus Woesearchaeota archaeon]|jgi:uncharacterized membrane protein|nr:vitamin K epoxide reductase family protein [Candidatus Woesearchaeota archaeon]MBT5740175.1 vitamin K epoxide reductase family protein [Candidatus Woesearchaeota archaeon]MBT6401873.1 vitamin K epoxide reductase family protein [Candidatus Woesearchaeota archaeon]
MKKTTIERILNIIIVLSIVGLLVSIYLLYTHIAPPTEGSICDISSTVSCSIVNSSVFAKLLGVPVSLFGAIWFVFLGLISWKAKRQKKLIQGLLPWNILGMLFVIYLIIAEILLKAVCLFCTAVHIITLITFILSIILYKQLSKKDKKKWFKIFKKWIVWIVIINLIPLIIFNVAGGEKKDHSELAQCITDKGVNMYGSFRCGVCAKTRAMFGDSFEHINEIECHPQGENPQTELCLSKNIEGTPTWILEPNGVEEKRFTGFLSIEELAEFSGCNLE